VWASAGVSESDAACRSDEQQGPSGPLSLVALMNYSPADESFSTRSGGC
jgi:hypothetical protein